MDVLNLIKNLQMRFCAFELLYEVNLAPQERHKSRFRRYSPPWKGTDINMKKIISVFLASLVLMTGFIFESSITVSAAGYVKPDVLDGTDNLFLSYTFYWESPLRGRRTKEGYLPLVGYHNTAGEVTDIFFDSYLFLPCVTTTPSGGRTYKDSNNPSNFSDWKAYVDDVFLDGYNVTALNEAVGEIKAQLGEEYADFKANIFLSILYPVMTQTNFGDVDGDGITENFNNQADRRKAIKWLVDEQISRLEQANCENLNLVGFYWFEESISYTNTTEKNLLDYMNGYVKGMDYKTIWIPYYSATGYSQWESLGFDAVCYQPNYMFNESAPSSRVKTACERAYNLGMGIEIEISGSVFSSVEYYNRYMQYLKVCTEEGANQGIKMYYNDAVNGVYYDAYMSDNPLIRRIYDLTYKYASQTLNPNEIVFLDDKTNNKGYEIVSLGCTYTTTQPFTNSSAGYASVSGKELTDGIFGSSAYDTEWIAFHNTLTQEGYYYINLDLGSVYNDLSLFELELNEYISAGISLPGSVEYLVSQDGISYQSLGMASFEKYFISFTLASVKLETPVTARYVRVKIQPGSHNFVFASELSVGVRDQGRLGEGLFANIALDKNYIATTPYTDSALEYALISGKELTDGVYAASQFGTEWHAFHISNTDEGKYTVTIDLGKVYSSISRFGMELSQITSASVGLPSKVQYYGSVDGTDYTYYGEVVPTLYNQYIYDAVLDTDYKTARFIKAVLDTGSHNFVFASEFFVGVPLAAIAPELTVKAGASLTLNKDNNLCGGLTVNNTAAALRAMFTQAVIITRADGTNAADDDTVGTGYTVSYYYSGLLAEQYTVSILGDTSGDGKITSVDYLIIKRAFLGTYALDTARTIAADINGDGIITSSDYLRIKRHFFGTYNIYEQ